MASLTRHGSAGTQRNPSSRRTWGVLIVVWCSLASAATGSEPWFPEQGAHAVHQRCMALEHPSTVLLVALQPGVEDIPLITYLRFFEGARTDVVYMTNGEGTPGDTLGRYPAWCTGERKLEADRLMARLGGEARFANVPDVPGPDGMAALRAVWDTAGAVKALTKVIRVREPDIVVLCVDRRTSRPSIRDTLLLAVGREAIKRAATTTDTSVSDGALPWVVARLALERRTGSMPEEFGKLHPFLNASAIALAREAARSYNTMRLRTGPWLTAGREYFLYEGTGHTGRLVRPSELVPRVPPASASVQELRTAIRSAIRTDSRGIRTTSLQPVSHAIDVVEHLFTTGGSGFTRPVQHLLVTWKDGLEALRCTLLGVDMQVAASESLLTASQLWYLHADPRMPAAARGTREIVLPAALHGEWLVNQTQTYHFPLDTATTFSILTPSTVAFVVPAPDYGLTQATMHTDFPYIIVHKDPVRERCFMYRGAVALRFGPRRSFDVRSPLVFDDRRSPVIVVMQNFSRDGLKGTLALSDSSGRSTSHPFAFTHKDEVITDTLYLPSDPLPGTESRMCAVEMPGRRVRRAVTARSFTVAIDSSVTVGLLSTVHDSPLEECLRVLRQPMVRLPVPGLQEHLRGIHTVLIDRDILGDPRIPAGEKEALEEWILAGGDLLVFPQHGDQQWLRAVCGAAFEAIDPLSPVAPITLAPSLFAHAPNTPTAADWEAWVETRASEIIVPSAGRRTVVPEIQSGPGALATRCVAGKGSVILVAMDLLSQLMNYHPGAYRLLANLIAVAGNAQ